MRFVNRLVFGRGFVEVAAVVVVSSAALGCGRADEIRQIPGPPTASVDVGGGATSGIPDADIGVPEPPEPALPSVLAERVNELFELRCVECHGNGMRWGGLGDLPALSTLLVSGQIVPGASAASPLLTVLQSEHPAPSRQDNVFVATASQGDVYYALTAQSATPDATGTRLGIDFEAAIQDGDVSRAAFSSRER